MISKCRDISNRINELENRVNVFSTSKSPLSEEKRRRPSTAPNNTVRAKSRVKVAHNMESQTQKQKNREMSVGNGNMGMIFDCTQDFRRFQTGVKCDAEKESDALELPLEQLHPFISHKNSATSNAKPFCRCMRGNSFDGSTTNMKEVTVMGMINSFPNKWPIMNTLDSTPSKLITPLSDDEKTMDNFLIDSLRGEIEKVRHKLCAIGKDPNKQPHINSSIHEEKNITSEYNAAGNHNYQPELIKIIKELQAKNDDLTQELETHKNMRENSIKKSQETADLLKVYENKLNTLHEQTLKSSKIIAYSKEKFGNILRSRNEQIKNLFNINQQLKRNMVNNEEQMAKLNNNYKMLKANYRELEKNDKRNKEENQKLREIMATLKEELKHVYKECSKLKEENMRFFKELNNTKEDIIKKYELKLDKQESHCRDIFSKTVENESKLMREVNNISENIHIQGNELKNLRSDVEYETTELRFKYKKLVYDYEALARKFREYEQFDEIKCSCIEQELKEFSMKMKEKENIILGERDDLRALVEELAKALKKNKSALRELNATNEQQESVIENLNDIIKEKDEQLGKYKEELKQVKILYENSKDEIDNLKKELTDMKEKFSPENEELEQLLRNSREMLNQEKDNNLIKQKIIQDHEETIKELKKQLNEKSDEVEMKVSSLAKMRTEVDRLTEDLKYRKFEIEKERKEKNRIQNELESIKTYKETLIEQISELEKAIKTRCRDDEINQLDQKETIDKLQKQIRQQKGEWEIQRKSLQKDKEKALHAARFASQKLLDTVGDFQKQMYQQKAAQTKLAMLLQAKEQQLENLTSKVRSLLPSQKESYNCVSNDSSGSHKICTSLHRTTQMYPAGSQQKYHSEKTLKTRESTVLSGKPVSCSVHCN